MVAFWCYNEAVLEHMMAVDLSIKQVPDEVTERLRQRAKRNHRSLQGELRAILEEVTNASPSLTLRELHERARARGRVDTGEPLLQTVHRMRDERLEQLQRTAVTRREGKSRR